MWSRVIPATHVPIRPYPAAERKPASTEVLLPQEPKGVSKPRHKLSNTTNSKRAPTSVQTNLLYKGILVSLNKPQFPPKARYTHEVKSRALAHWLAPITIQHPIDGIPITIQHTTCAETSRAFGIPESTLSRWKKKWERRQRWLLRLVHPPSTSLPSTLVETSSLPSSPHHSRGENDAIHPSSSMSHLRTLYPKPDIGQKLETSNSSHQSFALEDIKFVSKSSIDIVRDSEISDITLHDSKRDLRKPAQLVHCKYWELECELASEIWRWSQKLQGGQGANQAGKIARGIMMPEQPWMRKKAEEIWVRLQKEKKAKGERAEHKAFPFSYSWFRGFTGRYKRWVELRNDSFLNGPSSEFTTTVAKDTSDVAQITSVIKVDIHPHTSRGTHNTDDNDQYNTPQTLSPQCPCSPVSPPPLPLPPPLENTIDTIINYLRYNRRNSQLRSYETTPGQTIMRDTFADVGRYKLSHICNVAIIPLPSHEYLNGEEGTLVLCVFADGISRVKPSIIFKANAADNGDITELGKESPIWMTDCDRGVIVGLNKSGKWEGEKTLFPWIEAQLLTALGQNNSSINEAASSRGSILLVMPAEVIGYNSIHVKQWTFLDERDITPSIIPRGYEAVLQPVQVVVFKPFLQAITCMMNGAVEARKLGYGGLHKDENRRITVSRLVARAWENYHQMSSRTLITTFEQLGLSLPIDGSQDWRLKIGGMERIDIGDWRTDVAVTRKREREREIALSVWGQRAL